MIVKAYAKINLALNVFDRQSDGYHPLDMVMAPVNLHDTLDIDVVPPTYETLVTCDDLNLVIDEYNLALIAVKKMREFFHFTENFRIHIHKRIPMSAGLGGGSSDAAAVIRGIIALLKLDVKETDIIAVCRSIGSDVPFFYYQVPARVQGTGEIVTLIQIKRPYYVLLVKPKYGLTTKTVFAKYDEHPEPTSDIQPVIEALATGNDHLLGVAIFNKLEKAAMLLQPEIVTIKDQLKKDGFSIVMMSGSGSAVYALHDQLATLETAAKKYAKLQYQVLLTQLHTKEGKRI